MIVTARQLTAAGADTWTAAVVILISWAAGDRTMSAQ